MQQDTYKRKAAKQVCRRLLVDERPLGDGTDGDDKLRNRMKPPVDKPCAAAALLTLNYKSSESEDSR